MAKSRWETGRRTRSPWHGDGIDRQASIDSLTVDASGEACAQFSGRHGGIVFDAFRLRDRGSFIEWIEDRTELELYGLPPAGKKWRRWLAAAGLGSRVQTPLA